MTKDMQSVIEVVFKKGVLFDVTIGRWSALHQMNPKDLLLEKLNRKVIYPGHKKLLSEDDAYDIMHTEGLIRRYVQQKSMPFPISGAVFVNFRSLGAMLKGLKKLILSYEAAADYLVANYDEIQHRQLLVLDQEAEKIAVQNGLGSSELSQGENDILYQWLKDQKAKHRSLYPEKKDLRAKYYVGYRMFKVDPLEGSTEGMNDADADLVAQQQKLLQEDLEKWVKEQSSVVHQALGKAAAQAKTMLMENGKLNPKNLKPLFQAFESFSAIDFTGSNFLPIVESIKKKYLVTDTVGDANFTATAELVNGKSGEFSALLDTMAGLAVDAVAEKAGLTALLNSEFKRVVSL